MCSIKPRRILIIGAGASGMMAAAAAASPAPAVPAAQAAVKAAGTRTGAGVIEAPPTVPPADNRPVGKNGVPDREDKCNGVHHRGSSDDRETAKESAPGMTYPFFKAEPPVMERNTLVTVLEHNLEPGKKLLITGNGRCNYTNTDISPEHYHCSDPAFVSSVLDAFTYEDCIAFFRGIGIEPVIRHYRFDDTGYVYPECGAVTGDITGGDAIAGAGGGNAAAGGDTCSGACNGDGARGGGDTGEAGSVRSVPSSGGVGTGGRGDDGARRLRDALYNRCLGLGVRFRFGIHAEELGIKRDESGRFYSAMLSGERYDALIIATGSNAAPGTGSDSSIYPLLKSFKHTLGFGGFTPALCPLLSKDPYLSGMKGVRKDAEVLLLADDKCVGRCFGEVQFNQHSLSGIPVMQLSGLAGICINNKKKCRLVIDGHSYEVHRTAGFARAQCCAGGIGPGYVDPVTLESRVEPGVYICGELLDIDGECGGYNLHLAWATGHIAGQSAARHNQQPDT